LTGKRLSFSREWPRYVQTHRRFAAASGASRQELDAADAAAEPQLALVELVLRKSEPEAEVRCAWAYQDHFQRA
jgi:hypothetical protein